MAAWLSSTGISPSRGSRATLPIACDASPPDKWLHARAVAVRESHCPVGSYRPQAATPALRPCVSRSLLGEVMAHFPPGSSPTDRIRLPYAAGNFPPRLSLSKSPATYEERGGTRMRLRALYQLKAQDRDNQSCFQPSTQFFIYIGAVIAVLVTACPLTKSSYVTGPPHSPRLYRR